MLQDVEHLILRLFEGTIDNHEYSSAFGSLLHAAFVYHITLVTGQAATIVPLPDRLLKKFDWVMKHAATLQDVEGEPDLNIEICHE